MYGWRGRGAAVAGARAKRPRPERPRAKRPPRQLEALGLTDKWLRHRLAAGRVVRVGTGVFALAAALDHDPWARWMAATLTTPASVLSHVSAGAAWGVWSLPRDFEIVTRPARGGPQRMEGLLVFRSTTLDGETTTLRGIPITTISRTLLDLAATTSERATARAVREALRLRLTSMYVLADELGRFGGRRGVGRLGATLARYAGLPIERARSDAEVRAFEILRDAERELPPLNAWICGEEADLSWPRRRLIIEIDGGEFDLDVGEDARKRRCWEAAGWTVRRIPADDVYDAPWRPLELVDAERL